MENKIVIRLPNGYHLVAEQNSDPNYLNEIFIGILDEYGVWHQDLAVVRCAYEIDDEFRVHWKDEEFDVLVYSDENNEDFTHDFTVGLYHKEDGLNICGEHGCDGCLYQHHNDIDICKQEAARKNKMTF